MLRTSKRARQLIAFGIACWPSNNLHQSLIGMLSKGTREM